MSSGCPACGVAVVSGYVRCPKCGANQPVRRPTTMTAGGGTALAHRGSFPVVPVAVGASLVLAVVFVVAFRGGDAPAATPTDPPTTGQEPAEPRDPRPEASELPATPSAPSDPDPSEAARALDRSLKRKRLWGTVQVIGQRVDVRSGACSDPGMGPVLDAASSPLREAGVTQLRCLEQSGAVVFERDL